jgi:hypothetical protein
MREERSPATTGCIVAMRTGNSTRGRFACSGRKRGRGAGLYLQGGRTAHRRRGPRELPERSLAPPAPHVRATSDLPCWDKADAFGQVGPSGNGIPERRSRCELTTQAKRNHSLKLSPFSAWSRRHDLTGTVNLVKVRNLRCKKSRNGVGPLTDGAVGDRRWKTSISTPTNVENPSG